MSEEQFLFEEITELNKKVKSAEVPPDLKQRMERMTLRLNRMVKLGGYSAEYETLSHYIDWVTALPWDETSQDNLDLKQARETLEKHHYGMEKVKERILEYLAVLNLTSRKEKGEVLTGPEAAERSQVLFLVGLPGLGKTSVAYSIADALNKKFIRIAMGGMGSVAQLRGEPHHLPGAEPGLIIRNLRRAQVKNPVILLDEIDRVAEEGRAAIMGALLELLDPEQNCAFVDYFIDYPFDLSDVLFICSGNNTRDISNAVMDRMEVIEMPAYTDEEKKVIGRDYLLPKAIRAAGLEPEQIVIQEELWPKVIRPLGFDAGIRTLDRTINGMCRKIARMVVEGKGTKFVITPENVKQFLPRW